MKPKEKKTFIFVLPLFTVTHARILYQSRTFAILTGRTCEIIPKMMSALQKALSRLSRHLNVFSSASVSFHNYKSRPNNAVFLGQEAGIKRWSSGIFFYVLIVSNIIRHTFRIMRAQKSFKSAEGVEVTSGKTLFVQTDKVKDQPCQCTFWVWRYFFQNE